MSLITNKRYCRQTAYFGEANQKKLSKASIAIVGCGGLGSNAAELLTKAGIGSIKLIDGDIVDYSNLHRQHLFTEQDAKKSLQKATALAEKLRELNSEVKIEAVTEDLDKKNVEKVVEGRDIVLDGLDNMQSRFILNEVCDKLRVPWLYASCIRAVGYASFIANGGSCLNCFVKKLPVAIENCRAAGVLSTTTTLASSVQVNEAIKYLTGSKPTLISKLFIFDLEKMRFEIVKIKKDKNCRVCARHRYEFIV